MYLSVRIQNLWSSWPSVLSRDQSSSTLSQNLLFPLGSGHLPIPSRITLKCSYVTKPWSLLFVNWKPHWHLVPNLLSLLSAVTLDSNDNPSNTWTSKFLVLIFRENSHSVTKTSHLSSSIFSTYLFYGFPETFNPSTSFWNSHFRNFIFLPFLPRLDYISSFLTLYILGSLALLSFHSTFLENTILWKTNCLAFSLSCISAAEY